MEWFTRKSGLLTPDYSGLDAKTALDEAERILATARTISRPSGPVRHAEPAIPWSPFIEHIFNPFRYNAIANVRSAISSASATSVSFAATPAVGNCVVVFVAQYRGASTVPTQPTIADNQSGNTYTLVTNGTQTLSSGTDRWRLSAFVCNALVGASGTFTITETATDTDRTLVIIEYSGCHATPVDTSNNATTAAASTAITLALTTSVANCRGVAGMTGTNGSNPFSMTPANETTTGVRELENNSTAQAISVADDAWATAASHTAGFTHASSASVIVALALKPPAVSAGAIGAQYVRLEAFARFGPRTN